MLGFILSVLMVYGNEKNFDKNQTLVFKISTYQLESTPTNMNEVIKDKPPVVEASVSVKLKNGKGSARLLLEESQKKSSQKINNEKNKISLDVEITKEKKNSYYLVNFRYKRVVFEGFAALNGEEFLQPIWETKELTTQLSMQLGKPLNMGGLTRESITTANSKEERKKISVVFEILLRAEQKNK